MTNFPKICTNFPKRIKEFCYETIFRIYGSPPSPRVYNEPNTNTFLIQNKHPTKEIFGRAKTDPVRFEWGFGKGLLNDKFALFRVFLNPWFAKPMLWVRVAFHENHGNHENDEDNSDSYKQGVECWIRGNHGNPENDENHGNPGCKPRVPQTTGLERPDF